jgi:hypothetical protein
MRDNLLSYYAINENTTGITILSNDCTILSQPFTQKKNLHYNGTITDEETKGGFYV